MNNENKLIAEFMGFTSEKNIGWYDNNMMMTQNVYDTQNGNCFDELLFDISWDWLMPVVEKIESLGYSYDRINADVFINNQNGENVIPNPMDENTMTMIEKTYYVVLEFIKQYNDEQNKA